MSRARTPIAWDVLTPFGNRFSVTPEELEAVRAVKGKSVRVCDDGVTIAVKSWAESRETFYMPVYRKAA